MSHVTLRSVFDQAYDYAASLDAREERLTGAPIAAQDKTIIQRVHEAELRIVSILNDARRGDRPASHLMFAAVAHLAWLEQSLQEAEMRRVETGKEAA